MASPATEKLLQGNSEELGVPDRVRRFTWMDLGAVAVVLLAFVVALNAVLYKPTALLLGQTNQLILVGLMLSVMGFAPKGRYRNYYSSMKHALANPPFKILTPYSAPIISPRQ